jgi:hypothetical protein
MIHLRSLAILVAAVASGLVTGVIVFSALRAITGGNQSAIRLGFGIGVLSALTVLGYGTLCQERACRRPANCRSQPVWSAKAEHKMQTAEFRFALVFGVVAYLFTESALSTAGVVVAVSCCTLAGACLGYDIKRRVRRIRQQYNESCHPHTATLP